jgi:hypothetical protein
MQEGHGCSGLFAIQETNAEDKRAKYLSKNLKK